MHAPEPRRFVAVTPAGVRHWLAQPARSPERDVMERLLLLGGQHPVDLRAMSLALRCSLADLGRVLFVLNRSQAIEVASTPGGPAASRSQGLAGVDADLQALAGPGQAALLASEEGLCLGASGWSQAEAERRAAVLVQHGPTQGPPPGRWCFARQCLLWSFAAGVDPCHPAWVRLARRLLLACGGLSLDGEGRDAAR